MNYYVVMGSVHDTFDSSQHLVYPFSIKGPCLSETFKCRGSVKINKASMNHHGLSCYLSCQTLFITNALHQTPRSFYMSWPFMEDDDRCLTAWWSGPLEEEPHTEVYLSPMTRVSGRGRPPQLLLQTHFDPKSERLLSPFAECQSLILLHQQPPNNLGRGGNTKWCDSCRGLNCLE